MAPGGSHYFISYSTIDGTAHAEAIHAALRASGDLAPPWMYAIDGRLSLLGWDEQVEEAVKSCSAVLFIMTRDGVTSPECKYECNLAMRRWKWIIPLVFQSVDLPYRLDLYQRVDCRGDFAAAMAQLRTYLAWLPSPEAQLQQRKVRRDQLERDLRRAFEVDRPGIEHTIAVLTDEIRHWEQVVADPTAAARRTQANIDAGVASERRSPPRQVDSPPSRFINQPPGASPSHFQNRDAETRTLLRFVRDDAVRLVVVAGRGGVGKTALVCRLLKALEVQRLASAPHGNHLDIEALRHDPIDIEGIVYLSSAGTRRVSFSNAYVDLSSLLPAANRRSLEELYRDANASAAQKTNGLLSNFDRDATLLLLDNFEDLVDPRTRQIVDRELGEALVAILEAPHHRLKVIITTRIPPIDFDGVQPSRQWRLDLEHGLGSPHAETMLREMDPDGHLHLRDADQRILEQARLRTFGNPRALEAIVGILRADHDTSLEEVLERTGTFAPGDVVEKLVGEAHSRLDPSAQEVVQALAVYGRPVPPVAVDYLLQPFVPGIDSLPTLGRLVNMYFVRREPGERRYSLHHIDRAYTLSRIPTGTASPDGESGTEGAPSFSLTSLRTRAAEFFREIRKPKDQWKSLADLEPVLAEIELRMEAGGVVDALTLAYEIQTLLYQWGENQTIASLHEQLSSRLTEKRLQALSSGTLGRAYRCLGRAADGAARLEEALTLAHEAKEPRIVQGILIDLGGCYSQMGELLWAIDCHEEAFALAIREGRPGGCVVPIGNLSCCYGELGSSEDALEYAELAIGLFRSAESADRMNEGLHLHNVALSKIDVGRVAEAVDDAHTALAIGEELGSPSISAYAYEALVLATLLLGDLDRAWRHAVAAQAYRYPEVEHFAHLLRGLVAFRRGDSAAREAFTMARTESERLAQAGKSRRALDTWALALCGQILCGEAIPLREAADTFAEARKVTSGMGDIRRVLRLFDSLVPESRRADFAAVRLAAAGSDGGEQTSAMLDEGRRLKNLGTFYLASKRSEEAVARLEALARHDERRYGEEDARLVPALDLVASAYEKAGRPRDAVTARLHALVILTSRPGELDSTLVPRFKAVARGYSDLGDMDEADQVYLEALQRFPRNANVFGVYAFFCYFALRKADRALEHFDHSLRMANNDPNILANHSLVCLAIGEYERARTSLARASELRQAHPDRSTAKVLALYAVLALLEHQSPEPFLRYLKSLLTPDIECVDWPTAMFAAVLADRVPHEELAWLSVVMEAIGNRARRAELMTTGRWQALQPLPISEFLAAAAERESRN